MNFPRQKQEEVSVNLTPLIDVVFLLLIFFMVSTTFTKESRIKVDLPEAKASASAASEQMLEILITASGQYSLNGKPLTDTHAATLEQALSKISGNKTEIPLVITADANTPHQAVVRVMDVAGRLGYTKLSITTLELVD